MNRSTSLVDLLLQQPGTDINIRDTVCSCIYDEDSLFSFSIRRFSFLISYLTPREYAEKNNFNEIVDLFLKYRK